MSIEPIDPKTSPEAGNPKPKPDSPARNRAYLEYWIALILDTVILLVIALIYPSSFELVLAKAKFILPIIIALGGFSGILVGNKLKKGFTDLRSLLNNVYARTAISISMLMLLAFLFLLVADPMILRPRLQITANCDGEIGAGKLIIVVHKADSDAKPDTVRNEILNFNVLYPFSDCGTGDRFEIFYQPTDTQRYEGDSQRGIASLADMPIRLQVGKKRYRVPIEILPKFDFLEIANLPHFGPNDSGRVAPTLIVGTYRIHATARGFIPLEATLVVPDNIAFHKELDPERSRAIIRATRSLVPGRTRLIPGSVRVKDEATGSLFTVGTGEPCSLRVEHWYETSISAMQPRDLAHRRYVATKRIFLPSGCKDSTITVQVEQSPE